MQVPANCQKTIISESFGDLKRQETGIFLAANLEEVLANSDPTQFFILP